MKASKETVDALIDYLDERRWKVDDVVAMRIIQDLKFIREALPPLARRKAAYTRSEKRRQECRGTKRAGS